MNKIINYNIDFKDYIVKRIYRRDPGSLAMISYLKERLICLLKPSTLYKTLKYDEFTGFSPLSGDKRCLSMTLILVTIGEGPGGEIERLSGQERDIYLKLLDEALSQSLAFVQKLVSIESEKEGNQIFESRNSFQENWPVSWSEKIYRILGGKKIEVNLSENTFIPIFTVAGLSFWGKGRKKK